MSGIIVVDGLDKYLPPELRHTTEHVLALKDFQIVRDEIKTRAADRQTAGRDRRTWGRAAGPDVA
ncbi:hypothetical protein [Streptomyces sp. Ag109_O5-1]|uniref:hypothetical protein n=1 Tax=Streptomyces sp. Ag109_O5-1 TaxID=1938851 RepID=UPI0021A48079|nr:hypothetical protein [Streptomyces sp. Ag109_O5-1]